jgi:hypothetical protein
MPETLREALGSIMTVHDVERLMTLCLDDCLVNVELLTRVIDRKIPNGPGGIVWCRANMWTVISRDRIPSADLPIVNCIYDGGQGILCNEYQFVKMCDLLPWLDSIGKEETELTKHRDLALRIASALRFVIWYATNNVLAETANQLADSRDELEETRMELLTLQREHVKLLTKRPLEEPTPEEPPTKQTKQ